MSDADTIIELGDQLAAMCDSLDDLKQQLTAEREARLKAETNICELSICAIGAVNPSVLEYMQHWEQRAEAAESRIKASQEQPPDFYFWCNSEQDEYGVIDPIEYLGYPAERRKTFTPLFSRPIIPPTEAELLQRIAELEKQVKESK